MNAPSVEERLAHARGQAAVLAKLAERPPVDAPPPAFWRGLADLAEAIENDIAAIQEALGADATEQPAPTVLVER